MPGRHKDAIERHLDAWGPWLSKYPDVKGWWNDPAADDPDDPLELPVKGLLRLAPCHVLDFLQHFVVFETKKGRTIKKVARYQQFEAANDILNRILALIGKPVSAQDRTGLIWHTQGSGKSLTMIFVAYKLARTNRPLPVMDKRTGLVVDYFGVFANLARALNFDENIREEALIDWEALKATVPGEVARCLETFKGIRISDTRDCLLAALRTLKDPDAAKVFEVNFKSLERLWEAVSPDPCLYEHRYVYNWLCGIYIAHRRRQRGAAKSATFGELSAKTRELIERNTTFMDTAMALPVFKIDKDYLAKLDELPSAADKAAALEAMLTAELAEDTGGGFTYRQLGERLARIKARKGAADQAPELRLKELQEIADEVVKRVEEPGALYLTLPGEYALFVVLRQFAASKDTVYLATCARRMVAHLRDNQLLLPGWSSSKGGRMRVDDSLLAESWNPDYAALGFDPADVNP